MSSSTSNRFLFFVFSTLIALKPASQRYVVAKEISCFMTNFDKVGRFFLNDSKERWFDASAVMSMSSSATRRGSSGKEINNCEGINHPVLFVGGHYCDIIILFKIFSKLFKTPNNDLLHIYVFFRKVCL